MFMTKKVTDEMRQVYGDLKRYRSSPSYLTELSNRLTQVVATMDEVKRLLNDGSLTEDERKRLVDENRLNDAERVDLKHEIEFARVNISSKVVISDETIDRELHQIASIPQIIRMKVLKDRTIEILIRARISHEGETYDLSDWNVSLQRNSIHTFGYIVKEYRRSPETSKALNHHYNDHNTGDHPVYRLNGEMFCFGENIDQINQYYDRGEFVACLQLVTYALCSVNPEHTHMIPTFFRRITANVKGTTCNDSQTGMPVSTSSVSAERGLMFSNPF